MISHSESIAKIAAALVAISAEIENPHKNATNPHFRNRYADLAEIVNTARPITSKHGIAVVQSPGMEDGMLTVDTLILHTSGEWIRGRAASPLQKSDPQGVGSATTYLRRYSLAGMLGLAQEDDDGEGAVLRDSGAQQSQSNGRADPHEKLMPFGKTKGTRLGDLSPEQLESARAWCAATDADKFADLIADLDAVLVSHETAGV